MGPQQIQPARRPSTSAPSALIGLGRGPVAHRLVEDLECDRDLILAEESHRTGDLLDAAPIGCGEVAETR